MRRMLLLSALFIAALVHADDTKEVHVYQQMSYGGVTKQLNDQILSTGGSYTTLSAPVLGGYVFTHWSISCEQEFMNRDRYGRAKECVSYHLYESTTLTANYLPESEDKDTDGIADGWEYYWYGNLDKTAMSDSDGDGQTFADELSIGTNPLMYNDRAEGGILCDDGEKLQYNPTGLLPYTIRSEPEGELFATISDYVEPGTIVTTPTCTRLTTTFSYWTCNGVRVQDRSGRAVDGITFSMPSQEVEYVAHCISDADLREQFYWYGKEIEMTSDTDNDGLTLVEEIAAGTSPIMPNETVEGGIVWDQGNLLQYNPDAYKSYTIRSEPEGELFATQNDIVKVGAALTSPLCNRLTTTFAYWTLNGIRQQDRHGRALDQISFVMPKEPVDLVAHCVTNEDERMQFYWYGTATNMTSDTDNDGLTLAEEIVAGTNPLISDEMIEGGIMWDDGKQLETDLQVYEQVRGALVREVYTELFTSPIAGNAATSRTFANGAQIWPVVGDVNGDGLWDLIVLSATTTNVFANVGGKGNPQFEEVSTDCLATCGVDFAMNSIEKIVSMAFDVEPEGALSATTNSVTMLVSDDEGRIWLYVLDAENGNLYRLQHKVWGGSFAGFANGLMLAVVDWEDDGDLDCLAGTADGKLMLLRDPKVGRPTNLRAAAGIDNVKLDWDPNAQSRVRGYRIYRATGGSEYASLATPALPTYRDRDLAAGEYGYKVSALSRFYTAGNSTPLEAESVATDPVVATISGNVSLYWLEPLRRWDARVVHRLAISNSLNYVVNDLTVNRLYDPESLRYVAIESSGLFTNMTYTVSDDTGCVSLTISHAEAAPGRGVVLTFVFENVGGVFYDLLGDINANGVLDNSGNSGDLRSMNILINAPGRFKNAGKLEYATKVGDMNGDEKIDWTDFYLLRTELKKSGVLK